MVAVLSMVFLYIFVIYGTIFGVGYVVVKAAQNQALQNRQREQQPRHLPDAYQARYRSE